MLGTGVSWRRLTPCEQPGLLASVTVDEPVLGLWRALSRRDWDAVKMFLSADCIYVDMPVGPTLAARGPDDIVKRLKVGLEPLAGYENHDGVLVSNGADVMYEHSETWRWSSGETAVLRFVSVHRVDDGKVTLWKDYWDMGGMTAQAPPTWLEDLGDGGYVVDFRRDRTCLTASSSRPLQTLGVRVLFGPGRFGRMRRSPWRRWSSSRPCGRAIRRSPRRGPREGG